VIPVPLEAASPSGRFSRSLRRSTANEKCAEKDAGHARCTTGIVDSIRRFFRGIAWPTTCSVELAHWGAPIANKIAEGFREQESRMRKRKSILEPSR